MISKKKKERSSSQKRHKIWCQSTKNTNLDLDLRSRSPEPVNFFGAQSSLGGHNFRLGGHKQSVGGHGPDMPPRGAESGSIYGTVRLNFCYEVRYAGTVCLVCNVTGTIRVTIAL